MALKRLGMAVGAICFAALCARIVYVLVGDTREPWAFHGVEVLTPEIASGEPLRLRYDLDRVRHCQVDIVQFFIRLDTGEAVHRGRVPGGYGALGRHTTDVVMKLPFPFQPGRYAYRPVMESDCGVLAYATPAPDAVFSVK